MGKFESTTLRNKIHIKHGFSFKGEFFVSEGEYIILTPGNFYESGGFKFDIEKAKFYNGDFPKEYICSKGDLVVAMTEQAEGLLGSSAIVPEDNRFLHNQRIGLVTVNENEIDKQFLYHVFNTKSVRQQLRSSSSGSKVKHTSPDRIYDVIVNLPPLPTQQKIAAVLSALDAKVELNQRINAELESMAKTLYDYWFVQFDFPNEKGKPYKSAGGKMVWNEELKREIPLGWEVKPLFEAMDIQYGFPFSTTQFTDEITSVPIVRIRDILENTISTYTTETVDDKYRLNSKDLLIGMDGNFHLNFWDKDGAYLNQRSVRIRPRKDISISNFQAYFELSPYIKAREKNISRTTVGHLSDKDLKRLFIICVKETKDFKPKATFDALLEKIIANRLESQTLTELRDWLLPMLMNGQVKVGGRYGEK